MGDPEAEPNGYWLLLWTLYGLSCSPQHWYEKITFSFALVLPPLLRIRASSPISQDPNNPNNHVSDHPLPLGLYVDNFVYFFEDPKVEDLFCRLLSKRCKVDFMGIIEWFLGVHFSWQIFLSLV